MSRRLTSPSVLQDVRPLGARDPALDPFTRAQVEAATAEAFERGRQQGIADERAARGSAADRISTSLRRAVEEVRTELAAIRERQASEQVELALAVAEVVLARAAGVTQAELVPRIRAALEAIDDDVLEVHLHPEEAEVVGSTLADPRTTVCPDASLSPGEARIVGRWARAELTREAALAVAREALTGGEDHRG